MAYLNRATLIGNIGKDPEIKTLQNGRKFVSFSLATSKRYRDNNGEQKEATQWHNIVIWGKTAETFENIGIVKGTQLYIEGEITNRSWTDQTTGQKRYTTEINVSTFQILSSRNTHGTSCNGASNGSAYGASQQAQGNADHAYDYAKPPKQSQASAPTDDDLPF